jgi:outer membrane protein assembly factor BamB
VRADNFLHVYRPAEIGYDSPPPGLSRMRPARLARRLVLALVVGFLAGTAIMLQVKGWGTLISEAGGSCGTSSQGVSYGACPRGIAPALVTSFIIGLPSVPAAIALLFMKGWARRGLVAVGVAGGLLAGQSLFGIWHGTDLAVAWAAPHDGSSQLTTVAAWASGESLIRVRVDEAVSYDAMTGAQRWTLTMPGTDVACGVSGTSSSSAIGLIAYGQDSTSCDHVMAVNLATGRMIWSDPVQNPYSGNAPAGALAIAQDTAVVLTDNGIAGVSAASGAQRWTAAPPAGCSFQQLAASGGSLVALAACTGSFVIVSIDPTTGKAAWQHHVTEPSDSYQFQILSASPVVINDDLTGPRGTSTVRVFGPDGAVTSTFSVAGIPLGGGTVALNTASTDGFGVPVVVTDGMLAGVTEVNGPGDAIVGYRLADGTRQWLVRTPDEVRDVALSGGDLVFVDESDPAYSLEEVGVATGTQRSLGYFTQGILQTGESGLYAFGGDYLVVNSNGSSFSQPPVAAIKAQAVPGQA